MVVGVNVFTGEINPESPAKPMVCDRSIRLSKCEMEFLKKGPKFMLRHELSETEFAVDLQKMVVKEKYDKSGTITDTNLSDNNETLSVDEDESSNVVVETEDAKSRLVFDKSNKCLDLGKLTATDYKFNKYIHLPRPESSMRESLHEVRKDQMMSTFRKIKSSSNEVAKNAKNVTWCGKGAARRIQTKRRVKPTEVTRTRSNCMPKERACPAKYVSVELTPVLPPKSNERACPAKYALHDVAEENFAHDDERDCLAKYAPGEVAKESSTQGNERACPAKYGLHGSTEENNTQGYERDCLAKYFSGEAAEVKSIHA